MQLILSSLDNPKLRHIQHLRDSRKTRCEHQEFLLELPKSIEDLLTRNPMLISGIYIAQSCYEKYQGWADKVRLFCVEDRVFSALSTVKHSQGVLAVVHQKKWEFELNQCAKILIADGVSIPSNLGAMIRNGAAFGLDAFFVTAGSTDPHHPDSVRAASGFLDLFPIEVLTSAHISVLKDRRWIFFDPQSDSCLNVLDLAGPVVLVMGGEGQGVTHSLIEAVGASGKQVRIPTHSMVESLNVSVTSGIVLYLSR